MNLRDVEYIVKISEEGSLSHAAEKLFITPSALTQQLLHLEQEIGAPLFLRSRSGWTPTAAGEVYLKAAKEMLRLRKETYKQLQDIVIGRKGTLSIGLPPERGVSTFTAVYPDFHRAYPEITVNVQEISVRNQQQQLANGQLDIGFMTLREEQRTDDIYFLIKKEEMLLAVPAIHPVAQQGAGGCYPEVELSLLQYEPFAQMYKGSTMREFTDDLFRQKRFRPVTLFETARPQTIVRMVAANLCCGMVPESYAAAPHPNVRFLSMPEHPTWDIAASCRKGSYISQPMKEFIRLATVYWSRPASSDSPHD